MTLPELRMVMKQGIYIRVLCSLQSALLCGGEFCSYFPAGTLVIMWQAVKEEAMIGRNLDFSLSVLGLI